MNDTTTRAYRNPVEETGRWIEGQEHPFYRWATLELVARMAALPDANHRAAVEQEAHYLGNIGGGRYSDNLRRALSIVEAGDYSRLSSGRSYLELVGDDVCRSCNKIGEGFIKYAILFEFQGRFVNFETAPLCTTCGSHAEQWGTLKGRTFEQSLIVKALGTEPEFWHQYAK